MTDGENSLRIILPATQEGQLQELLAAERKRGEQHKRNYQRLKVDHHRLEEEHRSVHSAIEQLSAEYHRVQDASQDAIRRAQDAIQEKEEELAQLRLQLEAVTFTEESKKPEAVSNGKVSTYEKQLEALESECESLRQEATYLRHQQSMLLAQSRFDLLKAKRKAEEMQTRHSIELQAAQEVSSALSADPLQMSSAEEELQALRRENLHLQLRVKSLETECTNLRSSNDRNLAKSEEVARDHFRAVALHTSSLRDLESEKNHLKLQKEAVMVELASCRKECLATQAQCSSFRNELSHVKNLLSSMEHEHKVEIERITAHFSEEVEQVKTEMEAVVTELNSVQLDLRLSQEACAKQKVLHKEAELKWERKLEAAAQEQHDKEREMHDSRLILERKLKDIEKESEKVECHYKSLLSESERNLKSENESRMKAVEDSESMRAKVQELTEELRLEQRLHLELKKTFKDLELQAEKSQANFIGQIQHLQDHARITQHQLQKLQSEHASGLKSLDLKLEEHVQLSIEKGELEKKIGDLQLRIESAQLIHKQELNSYKKKIKDLVQESTKDQRTIKELKSLNRTIQKNVVSEEEHKQVLHNLQELQKRHHLFRSILLSTVDPKQISILNLEETLKSVST